MKSNEFLQAAIDVQKERGAQYDKPSGERSMGATVSAFNCITGNNLKEQDGWMLLGLLKLVRQSQNPEKYHHDSALDFVAYASLYAEAASEQCQPVEEVRKTGGKIPDGVTYIVGEGASEQCYPRDIPSWEDVKEDHFWMAQDDNGAWFSFPALPHINEFDEWYTEAGYASLDYKSESHEFWRDSLNCRPQQ